MTATSDLAPRRLRDILGTFATGLTVITSSTDQGPAGFTCQSFASLSLEPALVTFSPARTSSTWPLLRRAGSFTVNVLPAGHQHLAGQFARSGADKFAGVSHSASLWGIPSWTTPWPGSTANSMPSTTAATTPSWWRLSGT